MHLVKSNAELIEQENPFKLVELIGRTCYKSEDKITEDSCYKFVSNLIDRKHFAMLEHARFVFAVVGSQAPEVEKLFKNVPAVYTGTGTIHLDSRVYATTFVSVSMSHLFNPRWDTYMCHHMLKLFRNIVCNKYDFYLDVQDVKKYEEDYYKVFKTEAHLITDMDMIRGSLLPLFKHYSIKFKCDRGVSHELVRHRCAVAQESTRYCNYAKDKFGAGDIEFIYPHNYENWDKDVKILYEHTLKECERTYNYMISENMSPQQARAVLPNSLKTEVILTMNVDAWNHFFDLRYRGTTGSPHPDMKEVAQIAQNILSL